MTGNDKNTQKLWIFPRLTPHQTFFQLFWS